MTMLNQPHPDDERLAAIVGDDPADPALAAHLAACERCTGIVAELRSVRAALAGMPDIAPPRPLRLVPPVAAEQAPAGWVGVLRRLTAPAMALAVVLILVGAIGSTGALLQSAATGAAGVPQSFSGDTREMGASAAARPSAAASTGDALGYVSNPTPTAVSPVEPVSGGTKDQRLSVGEAGSQPSGVPYGWLLGVGVVLLTAVFLARAVIARTAPDHRAP